MSQPSDDYVDAELAGIREDLHRRVATHRRSRHRWTIVATGALGAGVAVALTAAAIAVIHATQEQLDTSVICYESADLNSRIVGAGIGQIGDPESGTNGKPGTLNPRELCGAMWRMGFLGQAAPPTDPNTADFPIPQLAICEGRDGSASGFPILDQRTEAEVCFDLGLARWTRP